MTDRTIVLLVVVAIACTVLWLAMSKDHTAMAWVAIGSFAMGAWIGFSIGTDRTI